ncbi:MAG: hypothetical protein DWQ02_10295 [Bacteroidetes bacterium]|nr:MAG: hypothetical protein DWQ02_10295 [Bacteroidota bacterium]
MESDIVQYYFHKGFFLFFSIGFLGISLMGIIDPESVTSTHNNEVVETTFLHLLPFTIFGLFTTIIFIWLTQNYFRVTVRDNGIRVNKINGSNLIKWDEIESLKGLDTFGKGFFYKVKPKQGKRFYFLSDRPGKPWKNFFDRGHRTRMQILIDKKKEELGI